MIDLLPDISAAAWSAGVATVAASAAVASWLLNLYRGAVAARATRAAERDRLWNDLIPQFSIRFVPKEGDRAELRMRLEGPLGLERLDVVHVSIRDDIPNRGKQTRPGGPTREEIEGQIWGPYRLNPNIENTDSKGRSVTFPDGVEVGEEIACALERTLMPAWSESRSPDWWQEEYRGKPTRLTLACERDGYRPWRTPVEAATTAAPMIH